MEPTIKNVIYQSLLAAVIQENEIESDILSINADSEWGRCFLQILKKVDTQLHYLRNPTHLVDSVQAALKRCEDIAIECMD